MKQLKLVMVLLISLTIMSCSNGTDKANESNTVSLKTQAENFLKNKLKDPKSYENISVEITDSMTDSESVSELLELYYTKDMVELGNAKQSERDSMLTLLTNYKTNPSSDSVKFVVIVILRTSKNAYIRTALTVN